MNGPFCILEAYTRAARPSDPFTARRVLEELRKEIPSFCHPQTTILQSTEAGMGLFAQGKIPAGTCVMIDHPVVSVLDCEAGSALYDSEEGSDSRCLIQKLIDCFSPDIESCLRALHPIRSSIGTPDVALPAMHSLPNTALLLSKLEKVLPSDIRPLNVVRAVQLNSLGYYTFPELTTYNDHLRFLTGTGLYPNASYFNHSCDPNVNHYSIGDVTIFRTLREVQSGEELCISYIGSDLLCESKSIRDHFLDCRDFDCSCVKCLTPEVEEDRWLDELELQDRIAIQMEENADARASRIRELIAANDYITRDLNELTFLLCRTLGSDCEADWKLLISRVQGSTDISAAIVLLHYMVHCGFTTGAGAEFIRIINLSLGKDIDWIALHKLMLATDFGVDVNLIRRFDDVWAEIDLLVSSKRVS